MTNKTLNNKVLLLFHAIPILITLVFTRSIMQGYSLPKLTILLIGISCLTMYMFKYNLIESVKANISLIWPIVLYIVIVFLTSLHNIQNLNLWFFGVDGRLTGVIYRIFISIYFVIALLMATNTVILNSLKILSGLGLSLSCFALLALTQPQINNDVFKLTFNNTNFSASFLAISAVSTLFLAHNSATYLSRIFHFLSLGIQFFLVLKIGDTQGYVYVLISFFLYLTIYIYDMFSKKFSIIWLFITSATGLYSIFQLSAGQGLLHKVLNTSSFQDRLYLWKYGIEIFKDNFLFGVGLTRYGDWEPRYRSADHLEKLNLDSKDYSLDPHNAFVQNAVEGGIFLFIVYLILIVFVTYKGFRSLSNPKTRYLSSTIFIIWIIYVLTKFISVDNISIDVWGLTCGAYLVYLSSPIFRETSNSILFSNTVISHPKRTFLESFSMVFVAFLILAPTVYTIQNLSQSFQLFSHIRVLNITSNQVQFEESAHKIVKLSHSVPIFEIRLAIIINLLKLNQIDSALLVAKSTTLDFPSRGEGWHALASIYEDLGEDNLAAKFRLKSIELRPLDETIKSDVS